jgi:hypothetical protein
MEVLARGDGDRDLCGTESGLDHRGGLSRAHALGVGAADVPGEAEAGVERCAEGLELAAFLLGVASHTEGELRRGAVLSSFEGHVRGVEAAERGRLRWLNVTVSGWGRQCDAPPVSVGTAPGPVRG